MYICVNGEDREISVGMTIYELVTDLELNPEQSGIAIAINREVIPKSRWQETVLIEDCDVEIIRAVQGG